MFFLGMMHRIVDLWVLLHNFNLMLNAQDSISWNLCQDLSITEYFQHAVVQNLKKNQLKEKCLVYVTENSVMLE